MATYKEYLENRIMESVEDENLKNLLMVTMESAKTISEIDSIEEVLDSIESPGEEHTESVDVIDLQLDIFEAFESGNITEEDRDNLLAMLEAAEGKEMTLKEQQDASGASTADNSGKNAGSEYDLDGYTAAEEKFEKGMEQIAQGDIEKGCNMCGQAVADALKIFYGVTSEISDGEIKKDIDEVKKDTKEFKDACSSGEITASDAKTSANKIRVKIKLIGKKLKAALSKGKSKATTESALDAIFEGASSGVLNDREIKHLLDALSDDESQNEASV